MNRFAFVLVSGGGDGGINLRGASVVNIYSFVRTKELSY